MAYTPDVDRVRGSRSPPRGDVAGAAPLWAGIGAYRLSPAQTDQNIQTARRLGADGIILFSYDSLTRPPRHAGLPDARSARAAFGQLITAQTAARIAR